MNTTVSAVLTAVVVTAGNWANNKQVPRSVFIGSAVYILGLSILAQGNEQFARRFAVLVLVGAVMIYGVDVARKLGYLK